MDSSSSSGEVMYSEEEEDVMMAEEEGEYSSMDWLMGANLTDDLDMTDLGSIINFVHDFGEDDDVVGAGGASATAATNVSSALDELLASSGLGDDDFLSRYANQLLTEAARAASGARAGDLFEFVVEGVLLTAVSLFGLVGNAVAIVVLSRPPMRGSFSTLLIGEGENRMYYCTVGTVLIRSRLFILFSKMYRFNSLRMWDATPAKKENSDISLVFGKCAAASSSSSSCGNNL